jgi:hypothetical protein
MKMTGHCLDSGSQMIKVCLFLPIKGKHIVKRQIHLNRQNRSNVVSGSRRDIGKERPERRGEPWRAGLGINWHRTAGKKLKSQVPVAQSSQVRQGRP